METRENDSRQAKLDQKKERNQKKLNALVERQKKKEARRAKKVKTPQKKEKTILSPDLLINSKQIIDSLPKEGIAVLVEKDGKKEITYKDGKKNGEAKTYTQEGILMEILSFKDDVLHGEVISFHENGQPAMKMTFEEGFLKGPIISYGNNGVTLFEVGYKGGKMEGEFKGYDAYGDLSQIAFYEEGLLHGPRTTFFPKALGQGVCQIEYYNKGVLVKSHEVYTPEGSLLEKTLYDEKGIPLTYPMKEND